MNLSFRSSYSIASFQNRLVNFGVKKELSPLENELEKIQRIYSGISPRFIIQKDICSGTEPKLFAKELRLRSRNARFSIAWGIGSEKVKINKEATSLLIQAAVIRKTYQDTRLTLLSAQNHRLSLLLYTFKELFSENYSQEVLDRFEFVRNPHEISSDLEGISKYKNRSYEKGMDSDPNVHAELISADVFPYSMQTGESAIYYLVKNKSVAVNRYPLFRQHFLSRAIVHQYPNIPFMDAMAFSEQLIEQDNKLSQEPPCGNLLTFSIPYEKVCQTIYRSLSGGSFICSKSEQEEIQFFKMLQQGKYLDPNEFDKMRQQGKSLDPNDFDIPQVRIYTPMLVPGNGIYIHYLTPEHRLIQEKRKCRISDMLKQFKEKMKVTVASNK